MQSQPLHKYLYLLQNRWGKVFQEQVTNIVAYGSGALPQSSERNSTLSNTLDLLVQVRNPYIFHSEVMRVSSSDYSGLVGVFGSGVLDWSYRSMFPMHSNHIVLDGRKIKYSVIGMNDLREDLYSWKYLSFAGRLHKPVIPLQQYQEYFERDININRQSALAVALLLLRRAKDYPLGLVFGKICEISYMGDVRFTAGAQNPKKVENIVNNNYAGFYDVYYPLIRNFSRQIKDLSCSSHSFSFQLTPPSLAKLISVLPSGIIQHLKEIYREEDDLVRQLLLSGVGDLDKDITDYIRKKNRSSSIKMAAQNFVTSSPINNLQYLLTKISKKK